MPATARFVPTPFSAPLHVRQAAFVIGFGKHLRRHWFVVARSTDILEIPTRVFFLGWPIVLARRDTGAVIALEDRCPHRGVPLSDGVIGPLGLVCRHHGWTFDESGRCTAMPGMPDGIAAADVRAACYSVVERDGLVWIGRGRDSLPDRVLAMKSENLRSVWRTKWASPVVEAQERFLGALQARRVLPRFARRAGCPAASVQLEADGDGVRLDHAGRLAYVSSLSTVQLEFRFSRMAAVWISVCFTPETLLSTHVFGTLHVDPHWVPSWLAAKLLPPFQDKIAGSRLPDDATNVVRTFLRQAWSGTPAGFAA